MPTPLTYYLNAPSLGSATAVFTDAGLTTCAADGFYSDGNIVRQQVDCVLLPQQECPACDTGCGSLIGNAGPSGVYYYALQLGAATGAVIIKFNPFSVPDGIIAYFNGNAYNTVSSVVYGVLSAPYGTPVYLGDTGSDCGLVSSSPFTLDEYVYDGGLYIPLGTTTSVSVSAPQVQTTATPPMNCIMVIPKVAATPSVLNLTVIGACSDTLSSLEVSCPALLASFACTQGYNTALELCSAAPLEDQTYYVAQFGPELLQLYNWVFSDAYGVTVLPDGFYQSKENSHGYDWFQVANGVIVNFGNC